MKRILPLMLTCIVLISCLIFPASAKEGTEGNELQVLQPEQLEIHLGAELAGAQFSLKTDAGMYPGTVAADANGILKLEIGGSSAYVLIRLDPETTAASAPASTESTGDPSSEASESAEAAAVTDPTAATEPAPQADNSIPTKHIILFAGGTVLCVAFLVTSFVLKRKREKAYEEDDEEY